METKPPELFVHESDAPDDRKQVVITVSLSDYAKLMKIMMAYGTGTGIGESSSVSLRRNLGNALICMRPVPERDTDTDAAFERAMVRGETAELMDRP